MHYKQKKWMFFCIICFGFMCALNSYAKPVFDIQWASKETVFPKIVGLHEPPLKHTLTITNTSAYDMPNMTYTAPTNYTIDLNNTTCKTSLAKKSPCQLALILNPNQEGHFAGKLSVCGGKVNWCSRSPTSFDVTVTANQIVSMNCNDIKPRPFATEDCKTAYQYGQNLEKFLTRVLKTTFATADFKQFFYFQHTPITDTTVDCLSATQPGVGLDSSIQGGGVPLCSLMSFATVNSSPTNNSSEGKLFPPYLTFLLGTQYPIQASTIPLDNLSDLSTKFGTPWMDDSVRDLGYVGYVNFINSYYKEQLGYPHAYSTCVTLGPTCPSIFYVPLQLPQSQLEHWPPSISYWGISGGGGSGAGYQIQAFKPGSPLHYTLFTGGGGGGGGMTTPEITAQKVTTLINTGSGGGGGSQYANCYTDSSHQNLNGLGLGAGTGGGISTVENIPVTFPAPPAVSYTYNAPTTNPSWSQQTILEHYKDNLTALVNLVSSLYDEGYVITVTGGGGGGAGMEFLNSSGQEFPKHPVSIGYGFNFCYAFQKDANINRSTDCVSSTTTVTSSGQTLDTIIYQNVGNFYNQGMALAILPENCPDGYSNFACTCAFQHAYVICQLENVLIANGYSSADIPTWLINPHCNDDSTQLMTQANAIDSFLLTSNSTTASCAKALQNFYTAKSTSCTPPWA